MYARCMIGAVLRRWWVAPLAAAAAYMLLRLGPDLAIMALGPRADRPLAADHTVADVLLWLPPAAPYAAGAALLLWTVLWFRGRGAARLLRRQRDMESLHALSWQDFEALSRELFEHEGWHVRLRGTSGRGRAGRKNGADEDDPHTHRGLGDGGVDLVLSSGDGETHLVQCKHWRLERVGVREVRELFGVVALERADGGAFVASGDYSTEAVRFAARAGIRLIDGDELLAAVLEVRGRNFARRRRPDPALLDLDADEAKADSHPPRVIPGCPACGIPMLERSHVRGRMAGKRFWGCPTYPHCRGTRKMRQ